MAPNNNNRKGRSDRNGSRPKTNQRKNDKRQPKRHFGCGICQADHSLTNCKKFKKMNLAEKYKTAVKLHYCVNCLARNHLIGKCSNRSRCQKCKGKHHTTLHGPDRILKDLPKEQSPPPVAKRTIAPIPAPRTIVMPIVATILPTSRTQTIVPTVVVQIVTDKSKQLVRAVLNPSLTTSKIGVAFVRESTLNPFKVDESVYVKVIISPNMASKIQYEVCMQVSNDLPRTPYAHGLDPAIKGKFCRISLVDPEFYANAPVAMEIGGDLYTTILQPNTIHIDGGSLIAQDSTLGWLVMGSLTN
ncbi:uncharacterized protein LOC119602003 isoform X1 [Lucilia sericata]|uniref:uncharacterized protein LOC119602003 isoform X1 n=1 Tax=Lucilia sericata TaxID=13632 RepID=UPI0018A85FAE|nr:uncharacterized protein LOC119602003 isoform X1 [Lucilia sericata]XP_037809238.1 uncharacterized protein LOC119602003 isoform X1 [Lucilia sericata]